MLSSVQGNAALAVRLGQSAGVESNRLDRTAKAESDVVAKVKQAVAQARDSRKSLARARLDQIRQRIEILAHFAAGDPAKLAELSRLARELRGAMVAYVDAGRSAAAAGTAVAQTGGADAAAGAPAAEGQTSAASALGGTAMAAQAGDDPSFAHDMRATIRRVKAMLADERLRRQRGETGGGADTQADDDLSAAEVAAAAPGGASILV